METNTPLGSRPTPDPAGLKNTFAGLIGIAAAAAAESPADEAAPSLPPPPSTASRFSWLRSGEVTTASSGKKRSLRG